MGANDSIEDIVVKPTSINICNIKLPDQSWKVSFGQGGESSSSERFYYQLLDGNPLMCQKMATVDLTKKRVKYTIISEELTTISEEKKTFQTIDDIEKLLVEFDNFRICPGFKTDKCIPSDIAIRVFTGTFKEGVWRSNKCSLILGECDKVECIGCNRLKKNDCSQCVGQLI